MATKKNTPAARPAPRAAVTLDGKTGAKLKLVKPRTLLESSEVVQMVNDIVTGYGALKSFVEAAVDGRISPQDFYTAVYEGRNDETVKKLTASIRATLMRLDSKKKLVITEKVKMIAIGMKDEKKDVRPNARGTGKKTDPAKVTQKIVAAAQATASGITGAKLEHNDIQAMSSALFAQTEAFIGKLKPTEVADFGKQMVALLKKLKAI